MFRRGFKTWCEGTAEHVRRRLGLLATAPLPPERLAKLLNAQIWSVDDIVALPADVRTRLKTTHAHVWSALTLGAKPPHVIICNPAHSPERRSSDLMHELAHILLDHTPGNMFFGAGGLALRTHNREQEDEARWLSACLLLPRESLFLILRSGWSDDETCARYGVSKDMLAFRRQTTAVERQFFGRGARGSSSPQRDLRRKRTQE